MITISRSGPSDRPAILALLAEARGDDLSTEERAERGFVQGRMDEQILADFQAATGVFAAWDGDRLVGVAATSLPSMPHEGPPAAMVRALRTVLPAEVQAKLFLYGPVAVDRTYQGRGILTQLLLQVCTELHDFTLGAAFVESVNRKSMAVHRHYSMNEITGFTVNGRSYVVFTFAPEDVRARYAG